MYLFKKEKYLKLLNGRTVEWLSKEVGYSSTMLYLIFNGHKSCKKALAIAIVKILDDANDMEEYFEEIR
jgi:hypothetical protein